MHISIFSSLLLLVLATPSLSHDTYCPSVPAQPNEQNAFFNEFIHILLTDRNPVEAYRRFVDVNLIEHNPSGPQGRDGNAAILAQILPNTTFTVLRQNFGNNLGIVHTRIETRPQPTALVDIYRFDGSCIVEHWDVTQVRPANATNPLALF